MNNTYKFDVIDKAIEYALHGLAYETRTVYAEGAFFLMSPANPRGAVDIPVFTPRNAQTIQLLKDNWKGDLVNTLQALSPLPDRYVPQGFECHSWVEPWADAIQYHVHLWRWAKPPFSPEGDTLQAAKYLAELFPQPHPGPYPVL